MTAFKDVLQRLFASHSHREVRRLLSSVAILNFAIASISLFEPIYLYTLGFGLAQILTFYFCVYLAYFFLLPIGARIAENLGFHHVILLSSPFLIAYYLSLLAIKNHPVFMLVAVLMYAIQKILYWPGYHGEMSRFGHDGERGREISSIASTGSLAAMLGPVFGGLVIAFYGFPLLFAVSSLLILVSNIPIMSLPDVKYRDGFTYRSAFSRLFSRGRRKGIVPFLGYGEELFAFVIWPIFIYLALKGFAATGALVSVSILISSLVFLYIGRLSDAQSRHAVLRTGALFTAASWFSRLFIRTPLGLLGSDAFYNISKSMASIPMLSILYSRAGKSETMHEIVLFEMTLSVGKMLAAIVGILVLLVFPGNFLALFVIAAAFSLLYGLLP